nr:glycosyltransferase family 2 protein [uncultured Halomonas sp.]
MSRSICILLAVYEGEKYLEVLLESVLTQSCHNWHMMIGDDSSSRNSEFLILKKINGYQNLLTFIEGVNKPLGAKKNFANLAGQCEKPYVMFCDQDDIWHEDKIKITFERMLEEEKKAPGVPVLVHSDLRVVDSDGNVIADSFFDYQKLPKKVASLDEALVKNNVTGCTVMLNRAAIDIAMPIPDEAIMHDWWIACKVIQAGGIISFIDRPLIDYRQHGANTIGAHKTTFFSYVRKAFKPKAAYVSYRDVRRQAKAMGAEIGLPKFLWLKARMLFRK